MLSKESGKEKTEIDEYEEEQEKDLQKKVIAFSKEKKLDRAKLEKSIDADAEDIKTKLKAVKINVGRYREWIIKEHPEYTEEKVNEVVKEYEKDLKERADIADS